MNRPKGKKGAKTIRIPSFGAVIGLGFNHGGFAEVAMSWPEFSYVLHAWEKYERKRPEPDERVLAALDLLDHKVHKLGAVFVAEVPIAPRRAKITPVFRGE
jgi:hypothetical protein